VPAFQGNWKHADTFIAPHEFLNHECFKSRLKISTLYFRTRSYNCHNLT